MNFLEYSKTGIASMDENIWYSSVTTIIQTITHFLFQ